MQSGSYKISSLEIENFRQYRNADIKFSCDPEKTFTILRGANGAGKTNIMNAITWCLYGTEKHLGLTEKDMPIVNIRALKEKPTGLVNTRVKLTLADEQGDKFKIERKLSLYNNGGTKTVIDSDTKLPIPENSIPSLGSSFQSYDPERGGWETTEYFSKSVKELLPEDLAIYFLFDGEKLEEFFEQVDDTRKGIEDVSQIKLAEKAIRSLETLILQIRKNAKNLNPQSAESKKKMDATKSELDRVQSEIKMISEKLAKKKARVQEIEQFMIKSGGNVGEYQQQASEVKKEIVRIQEQYDAARSERQNYILDHMYGIQALDSIHKTLESIKKKGREGILPPKIKDTFLKELLDGGKCICGGDISDGTSSRMHVSRLLQNAQYSGISEICTELRFELKQILETDDIKSDLTKKEQDMLAHADRRKQKREELADLEAKIGNIDDELIKQRHNEKRSLDDEIAEMNQTLGSKKADEEELKKEYEKAARSYDNELSKDDQHGYLNRQLKFCQSALYELEKIKNELLDEVRIKVQNHTKDYFLKFLWKKDTYDGVTISDDYNITVHHVDGYDVKTSLSKGEKLVLALSFMAALRKITGFAFPLIIDTPLGRVSGEPRYNIAHSLPDFLKNNQVTLLVTDSEYQAEIQDDDNKQKFPPIRDIINKHVGEDYDINFTNTGSKVEKH